MKNNTTRKTMLALAAFAFCTSLTVSAQEKKDTPLLSRAWVAINTEMLNVQLKLNDTQKEEVRDIDKRYTEKHAAMEAKVPKPTDKEMSEQVEGLMTARDKEMRKVLNTDQYTQWEKMRHKGTNDLEGDQKEKLKSTDKD